jgi:hypothetical protein
VKLLALALVALALVLALGGTSVAARIADSPSAFIRRAARTDE